MGGRYLVTGVQLGMIKGYAKAKVLKEIDLLATYILDNQYIGDSQKNIKEDCEELLDKKSK
ncbi:MAG: hypothetical protein ACFFG0_24400 [Candidatus Thorarchaeota archaeon]